MKVFISWSGGFSKQLAEGLMSGEQRYATALAEALISFAPVESEEGSPSRSTILTDD